MPSPVIGNVCQVSTRFLRRVRLKMERGRPNLFRPPRLRVLSVTKLAMGWNCSGACSLVLLDACRVFVSAPKPAFFLFIGWNHLCCVLARRGIAWEFLATERLWLR